MNTSYGFKKDAAAGIATVCTPIYLVLFGLFIAPWFIMYLMVKHGPAACRVLSHAIVTASRWVRWAWQSWRWVRRQPDRKAARQQVYAVLEARIPTA